MFFRKYILTPTASASGKAGQDYSQKLYTVLDRMYKRWQFLLFGRFCSSMFEPGQNKTS